MVPGPLPGIIKEPVVLVAGKGDSGLGTASVPVVLFLLSGMGKVLIDPASLVGMEKVLEVPISLFPAGNERVTLPNSRGDI